MERLDAAAAAEHVRSTDTLGIPLATGQPPAFLDALGAREDWEELRVYGALLLVYSPVFQHPNVHYQVDVIVTEHGAAELQGKTVHQRGEALAAVAHPDFREGLLEAAGRASGGRAPWHEEKATG